MGISQQHLICTVLCYFPLGLVFSFLTLNIHQQSRPRRDKPFQTLLFKEFRPSGEIVQIQDLRGKRRELYILRGNENKPQKHSTFRQIQYTILDGVDTRTILRLFSRVHTHTRTRMLCSQVLYKQYNLPTNRNYIETHVSSWHSK